MLYAMFRDLALTLMKAPAQPPTPPAGSHDSVEIYRASPRFLTINLLLLWGVAVLGTLALATLLLVGLARGERGLVAVALVAGGVLAIVLFCAYFAVRIDWEMRYYIATDRSLRVREGAFVVKEKTISYANVQNLRVLQGPLLRLFGISTLRVETAGGGASERGKPGGSGREVELAGIENAHAVRDRILANLRARGGGAGLGDLDDEATSVPSSGSLVDALAELRRATAGLRAAVERARPGPG